MNLLFFDIECACVRKNVAKICAFGYVLCNKKFKILKKEDILINPRGEFRLTDKSGEKGLVLPYAYEEFIKYPRFCKVYKRIKAMLENKNNVILGHSTINDVKYLNLETKRFQLPSFEFTYSDSQLLYMSYINDFSRQLGLELIARNLGVEFTPHRAADDAYATMKIVEAMCKEQNCGYHELAKRLRIKEGKITNYTITPPSSHAMRSHSAQTRALKHERAKIHTQFVSYLGKLHENNEGKFKGKIFTFSRAIEDDLELSKRLAEKIYAAGGIYSMHLTHCHYFIAEKGDDSPRTENALKVPRIKVIDLAELEAMLDD